MQLSFGAGLSFMLGARIEKEEKAVEFRRDPQSSGRLREEKGKE